MKNKQETEITILSDILRCIKEEGCEDNDDYASNLAASYYDFLVNGKDENRFFKNASKIKTNFFKFNRIKKNDFLKLILKRLTKKEIKPVTTNLKPALSFYDLFPEIKKINDRRIAAIDQKLNIKEEIIQNALREAFREKLAFPISRRGKDSSLEVADIEHFNAKIKGQNLSFTAVVKGYRSLKGSKNPSRKLNWEDISHQVTKAYSRTRPDYVIVVSAREPVDSLVSEITSYGESVGNKNLIIFVPPLDLIKFLIWKKIIDLKSKRNASGIKKTFFRRHEKDRTPWNTWKFLTNAGTYEIAVDFPKGKIDRFYLNRKTLSLIIELKAEKSGKLKVELDRYLIDSKISLNNDKPFTVVINDEEINYVEKLGDESRILSIPIKKGVTKVEIIGTEVEGIFYLGFVKKENTVNISKKNSKREVFNPKILTIKKGEKVRWQNNDNVDHTVTSGISKKMTDSLFNTIITPSNWFEVGFNIPGTYEYFCSFHPREKGKIIVEKSNMK